MTRSAKTEKLQLKLHATRTADGYFWGVFVLFLILLAAISILKPAKFYTLNNLSSMLSQFPQYGIMAFGVMIAMILGGIDLSVVSIANLSTIVAALIIKGNITDETSVSEALPIIIGALALALVIGLVCGYINGVLIAHVSIPPILATLGTASLYKGLCIALTGGSIISGLPRVYSKLTNTDLFGVIPLPFVLFLLCVVFMWIMLTKTAYGRKLYMIGTNRTAASFSGIPVASVTTRAYIISGILAAIGGLVMMSRMNSAKADYASSYTMQCILIVVLGGVSPSGGFGKLKGVVVSILVVQLISSGLNLFPDISNYYKQLIWGLVLICVMSVKFLAGRRKQAGIGRVAQYAARHKATVQ